jgi:hypothetical protein
MTYDTPPKGLNANENYHVPVRTKRLVVVEESVRSKQKAGDNTMAKSKD